MSQKYDAVFSLNFLKFDRSSLAAFQLFKHERATFFILSDIFEKIFHLGLTHLCAEWQADICLLTPSAVNLLLGWHWSQGTEDEV